MANAYGLTVTDWNYDDVTLSALNAVLMEVDVSNYDYAVIQVGPQAGQSLPGAGAVTLEGTIDGVNWFVVPSLKLDQSGSVVTTGIVAATAVNILYASLGFRRLRARVSTALTTRPLGPFFHVLLKRGVIPHLL